MLTIILIIYAIAGISYWSIKATRKIPALAEWVLFVCFLPFIFVYALFKTLPDFKKGGKYHGARWIVYFTAVWVVLITILLIV